MLACTSNVLGIRVDMQNNYLPCSTSNRYWIAICYVSGGKRRVDDFYATSFDTTQMYIAHWWIYPWGSDIPAINRSHWDHIKNCFVDLSAWTKLIVCLRMVSLKGCGSLTTNRRIANCNYRTVRYKRTMLYREKAFWLPDISVYVHSVFVSIP